MKVTKEFLREKHACAGGYKWFCENCLELDFETQIKQLKQHRFDWANWLLVRLMSLEQKRKYAIFAAEKVLHIFEAKYIDDKRPRKAIEAAAIVVENDTKENRSAADAAADAAYTAYDAAYTVAADAASSAAAASAASAAASAADTSAYAYAYADDAAAAADAAYDAALAVAEDSAYADDAADAVAALAAIKETIIDKGIELIKKDIKK